MPDISYTERKAAWFADRALRRQAGVFHLWAFGVGAVISGGFFGWNFGLIAGGFGANFYLRRADDDPLHQSLLQRGPAQKRQARRLA